MKTRRILTVMVVTAVSALAVSAYGATSWSETDGAGTASGDGTLSFVDALSLNSLSLVATDGPLTLSGPGITFNGASPSVSYFGDNILNIPITAAGALSFLADDSSVVKRTYDSDCLKTTDTQLFTDMDLSQFDVASAVGAGTYMPSGFAFKPFHPRRESGSLFVQMQGVDGAYTKCVKVRLTQSGQNVFGRIMYARYSSAGDYGIDFDNDPYTASIAIATSPRNEGYGIGSITLAYIHHTSITALKPIEAGSLVFGAESDFTADGQEVLGDGGNVTCPMTISGTLTITNARNTAFTSTLSGAGTLNLAGCGPIKTSYAEITYDEAMSSAWRVVAEGSLLQAITNIYVNAFLGSAITATPGTWIRHFRDSGSGTMIGQCVQVNSPWLKCVYLEFRQSGTNVESRIRDCWYTTSNSQSADTDFDTLQDTTSSSPGVGYRKSYSISSSPSTSGYGIGSFTMYFNSEDYFSGSDVAYVSFETENAMSSGATIYQHGGTVRVSHRDGLPKVAGRYHLSAGGRLILEATNSEMTHGTSNGKTKIWATEGSTIVADRNHVIDRDRQELFLDASVLSINASYNTYVNKLTLANGSQVADKAPLLTYGGHALWNVRGTSPSFVKKGLTLASVSGHVCNINVEDVTGDGDVDLIVDGELKTYDSNHHTNVYFRKTGVGTMSLSEPVRLYKPMRIDGGTIQLNTSGILSGKYPAVSIQLGGGGLSAVAGTSNTASTLTVTNNATIAVASGATLAFADSSGAVWTPGMKLAITGDVDGASVRFGTSSAALTPDQQRMLYVNGDRAMLDRNGYVVSGRPGTQLLFR